jgi:hypothetical protein
MAEVTKEDINRIYDKLEPMATDLAVIKSQMEEHLKSHKTWEDTLVGGAVKIVICAVIGLFSYLWGTRQ